MKKFIISIFIAFLTISTYCQTTATLSETLNWIKSKIEAYPLCEQICYKANVQYDISKKEVSVTYISNLNNQVTYMIPLSNINTGGYSYTKDYLFKITTYGQSITWDEIDSYGNRKIKKVSEVYLVFDGAQFRANDLESRLIKAFNNAVRLSGGNVVKEVF